MPSGMNVNIDSAPIYGMNTVDDPATLKDGECELLVNAFPGNPPKMRPGCIFKKLNLTANHAVCPADYLIYEEISKLIFITTIEPSKGVAYFLMSFDKALNSYSDIAYILFQNNKYPFFDIIKAHYSLYVIISKEMTLFTSDKSNTLNQAYPKGSKVIESDGETIRDMCISATAHLNVLTQEESLNGGMSVGYYCYAMTYVRRIDETAYSVGTPIDGVILPAFFSNKIPVVANTYMPGAVESPETYLNRKVVNVNGTNNSVRIFRDSCATHEEAICQGATHIRVFRTQVQTSSDDALGATKYWLVDIPIAGATGSEYLDKISDATLSGELNQLCMDQYDNAPLAKFAEFHNGRMWLYGIEGRNGYSFYSEIAGGDGKTELDLAILYPQKYASMFKLTEYYVDCEHADGLKDTGIARLNNDIYFFKESKIFVLYGGDPQQSTVQNLSETIGCAFPFSITKCEIKGMFGNCILFLSNKGPYVLKSGGELEPFSRFKIKELWPDISRELYEDLNDNYDYAIRNCSASFYRDTWWIFYKNSNGVSKKFGYYFSNTLSTESDSPNGPMQLKFSSEYQEGVLPWRYEELIPVYLALKNDSEAILLCNKDNQLDPGLKHPVLCNFLSNKDDTGSFVYEDISEEVTNV